MPGSTAALDAPAAYGPFMVTPTLTSADVTNWIGMLAPGLNELVAGWHNEIPPEELGSRLLTLHQVLRSAALRHMDVNAWLHKPINLDDASSRFRWLRARGAVTVARRQLWQHELFERYQSFQPDSGWEQPSGLTYEDFVYATVHGRTPLALLHGHHWRALLFALNSQPRLQFRPRARTETMFTPWPEDKHIETGHVDGDGGAPKRNFDDPWLGLPDEQQAEVDAILDERLPFPAEADLLSDTATYERLREVSGLNAREFEQFSRVRPDLSLTDFDVGDITARVEDHNRTMRNSMPGSWYLPSPDEKYREFARTRLEWTGALLQLAWERTALPLDAWWKQPAGQRMRSCVHECLWQDAIAAVISAPYRFPPRLTYTKNVPAPMTGWHVAVYALESRPDDSGERLVLPPDWPQRPLSNPNRLHGGYPFLDINYLSEASWRPEETLPW